jgi:DNA-binding NtrC family response regulator
MGRTSLTKSAVIRLAGNAATSQAAIVEEVERRMIREALARSGGIQTRGVELLGISERGLRYKLNKYGLCIRIPILDNVAPDL